MELIKVDKSICTKCGTCTRVCPTNALYMEEDGPKVNESSDCIACGQCTAVCPKAALDNIKAPIAKQEEIEKFPVLNADAAEHFLRSRRSIRCYKNISVPREDLLRLVNIARYAPTASNSQGLTYIIVQNKNTLEKAVEIIISWMERQLDKPTHWSFARHVRMYREKGIDSVLRNAPSLILATAARDFKNGRENTISALSYAELFAPSIGLGSCWAGLFEMCIFSNYAPLIKLFDVPEGKVITGALMVGYPQYKYKRLVDRDSLDLKFL